MSLLGLWRLLFPDRRGAWEKKQERQFLEALGRLRDLNVLDRGGLSIDPEKFREKLIQSQERNRFLVDRSSENQRL